MIFIIYFAKKNNLCKDKISKEIELVSLTPYLTPGKDNKVKVKDVADFQRLEIELREIFSIALDEHIEKGVIEKQRTEICEVIDEALSKNALKDLAEAALIDPLADLKEFVRNYKLPEGPTIFNPRISIMQPTKYTHTREDELLDNSNNNSDFFKPSVIRRNYNPPKPGGPLSMNTYNDHGNNTYDRGYNTNSSTGSKRSRSNRNNNNNRITKRRGGYGGKKTKKHNQKRKINKKKITKKNKKNVRKMTRKNKQKK